MANPLIMFNLEDVLKFAPVKIGDTIVTGGESSIFPKGIAIGTITVLKVILAEILIPFKSNYLMI